MRFDFKLNKGVAKFRFRTDKDDIKQIENLKFSMNNIEIYVDLGDHFDDRDLHPDLVCLAAILLSGPFIGSKLEIPFGISEDFFNEATNVISRYKLVPKKGFVAPIGKRDSGRPGLAYSGGADSSAALAIMPMDTIPIFLNRPMSEKSKYDSSAPLELCSELQEAGYDVKIISSNLELIRNPIGFPTDLAHAIPAILLSKKLNLDSIAFGTVLESGYGIGHEKFIDYGRGAHWRFFSTLFTSVGIDLSMPVIGISEVGTSIIVNKSPLGIVSQSCIRGNLGDPCLKCWKCFRKQLLCYSLGFIDTVDFLPMLDSNEVQVRLSAFPISHENIIIFSLQRIDLDQHPYFKPIADKLNMDLDLSHLESWYSDSIEFVPEKYRHEIRHKILQQMKLMSINGEYGVNTWDMAPHLDSPKAKKAQEKLTLYWQDLHERFG